MKIMCETICFYNVSVDLIMALNQMIVFYKQVLVRESMNLISN